MPLWPPMLAENTAIKDRGDRQPKVLQPEPRLACDPLDPRIGSWPR